MDSADAAWLHMDRPTSLMVVNGVLWFDEPLDAERVRDVIGKRLVAPYPRFRQRVVEPRMGVGRPAWEDDPNFDLDRHIHLLSLPAPGDRAALQKLISDLMSMPLDRSRPLWDMYLIDGYERGTALVSRMHHCIADGIALSRVLLSLTDDEPDAGIAPAAPPRSGRGSPLGALTAPLRAGARLAQATVSEGMEVLLHPGPELHELVSRSVADSQALGKLMLTPPDSKSVLRGELTGSQRVAWTDPIALDDVKAIGHATGTTVNDVLVAAVTGALHRYLVGRHGLVKEIRATVPFNLRPLDEPLPAELGNRFGLVYLTLPVGLRSPRRRLEAVHDSMEAIKHSPEGAIAYGVLEALGHAPSAVEQRLLDAFSAQSSAVVTNVPGPRRPVYLAGSPVAGVLAWVPATGSIGLGISIFSYDGGVTIGVRTDSGCVDDPQAILESLAVEFEALARYATG